VQAEADSLLHALEGIAALSADPGSVGPAGADGDPGSGFNPDYSAFAGIPADAGFTIRPASRRPSAQGDCDLFEVVEGLLKSALHP
jgi:hypothetical protein